MPESPDRCSSAHARPAQLAHDQARWLHLTGQLAIPHCRESRCTGREIDEMLASTRRIVCDTRAPEGVASGRLQEFVTTTIKYLCDTQVHTRQVAVIIYL